MMLKSRKVAAAEATLRSSADQIDIAIPVVGATGAGKSSFINEVLASIAHESRVGVGEGLSSCTVDLETVVIETETTLTKGYVHIRDQRVFLVDTPGFDNTSTSDFEKLKHIANWLDQSYKKGVILGGVIYLHDISEDRFTGAARRNLEMFNHLCGRDILDKTVLVTAKWSRADESRDFDKRQKELETRHWKWMLDRGASAIELHGNEREIAGKILRDILKKVEERARKKVETAIQEIQRELGNEAILVAEMRAVEELKNQFRTMVEAQQEMVKLESRAANGDPEAKGELESMHEKIERVAEQIDHLKRTFAQSRLQPRLRRLISRLLRPFHYALS